MSKFKGNFSLRVRHHQTMKITQVLGYGNGYEARLVQGTMDNEQKRQYTVHRLSFHVHRP
jgi:hypothetical protein